MRYREKFYIGERKLEYIGVLIPLYGLTDLIIDFYYEELLANEYLSTAAAVAGTSSEQAYGKSDKKLRCIAETAEGRKVLSNFTYWGNSFHHAAKGYSRMCPDWYINPKGPDGYIVHGRIYSRYLYEPLSKEELYKRNVGKGIPPGPGAFKSVFTGVTNIFARAIGLGRMLPSDEVKEIIPIKEKTDLGLFADLVSGDADVADVVEAGSGDEFEDAPEDTSQIDYVSMLAAPPPPGGGEYIPVTVREIIRPESTAEYDPEILRPSVPRTPARLSSEATSAPSPSMPALIEEGPPKRGVIPIPIQQASHEPSEEEIKAIVRSNKEKMGRTIEPGSEDRLELIVPIGNKVGELIYPDFDKEGNLKTFKRERPSDPDDVHALEKYIEKCKPFLSRELDKIDRVGDDQLPNFAKELGVKLKSTDSNAVKRLNLKREFINKAADQMGVATSAYSDLITFKSSKDYNLPLLPRELAAMEEGLLIIENRQKFLKTDLLTYIEMYNIITEPKASADDLRVIVIKHYLKHSERSLTVEEEKKYQDAYEDLVKRYVKE